MMSNTCGVLYLKEFDNPSAVQVSTTTYLVSINGGRWREVHLDGHGFAIDLCAKFRIKAIWENLHTGEVETGTTEEVEFLGATHILVDSVNSPTHFIMGDELLRLHDNKGRGLWSVALYGVASVVDQAILHISGEDFHLYITGVGFGVQSAGGTAWIDKEWMEKNKDKDPEGKVDFHMTNLVVYTHVYGYNFIDHTDMVIKGDLGGLIIGAHPEITYCVSNNKNEHYINKTTV